MHLFSCNLHANSLKPNRLEMAFPSPWLPQASSLSALDWALLSLIHGEHGFSSGRMLAPPHRCWCPQASFKIIPQSKGARVAQSVKHLTSAPVLIPGAWNQSPDWAPCWTRSLLLPLPTALLSQMNKNIKSLKYIYNSTIQNSLCISQSIKC